MKPVFKEGLEAACQERTTISLKDDDISMMEIIFKILHHSCEDLPKTMNANTLALLTIHCHKYDVTRAVGPWIWRWYSGIEPITNPDEDLGYLILIAFYLDDEEMFTKISARAITELASGFVAKWNENDILDILPEAIAG